jgi:hypothetical protein
MAEGEEEKSLVRQAFEAVDAVCSEASARASAASHAWGAAGLSFFLPQPLASDKLPHANI